MPRVLSLKKTSAPKNQIVITQFFKSQTKDQPSVTRTDSKSSKRKAPSPCSPTESITIEDDPCQSTHSKRPCNSKLDEYSPNKFKSEQKKSSQYEIAKQKTNSPHKENDSFNLTSKSMTDKDQESTRWISVNDNAECLVNNERSPLTPVKLEKSCILLENGTEHQSVAKQKSPKEVLDFVQGLSPLKRNRTPNKTHGSGKKLNSPQLSKLRTPKKLTQDELSPSKSGSTVKALDFGQDVADMFGDDWNGFDVEEYIDDLDLTTMQRCEVVSVIRHPTRLELRLKSAPDHKAICFVEGMWLDTPLSSGDVISILANKDSNGQFCVGNKSGLISLRPDHLVSSTSVVAGVFCKRKAILQERWKGIDSANTAMTIGILIHELVQNALTQNITNISNLQSEANRIIKESTQLLYDAGLTEVEAHSNIQSYIQSLSDFMNLYVADKPPVYKKQQKDQWAGHIDKVLDIEENLCCPQLGMKGKIDATLEVTIHERKGRHRLVAPLELKSGKASMSAEHRGQLVLYGMMLSLLRREDPSRAEQRGLLLYLKDRVELKEVSCGYPERRDLVMLRNQLVQYLSNGPDDVDPEQFTDIEDASCLLQQRLPEPVHHENACTKCPYLTICSVHLWHTDGPSVPDTHPLSRLRQQALGHLLPAHIKYFLLWAALLKVEEKGQMLASPLHALWTDSVERRATRGTCAAHLKLKSVQNSGDRFLHIFERHINHIDTLKNCGRKSTRGPQEGEFSIVSIESRPWIAAGVVSYANDKQISILLERDLSRRHSKDLFFSIDTYESYATAVQNLTNLGVLMEDSDRALRLRKLIIDKETPEFDKKLPREVGRLGTKLMRNLNIEQQRAVLKALSAKDYALLQGLPGTGKTQTVSVLIQMLVGLKQRVLVTAHTHSAVDNVLARLPETIRVMRLGSWTRVASNLQHRSERHLTAACETTLQLGQLYESMEVVGVTCLGAAHAMLSRTTFDVCIVDEATQVLQSTILRPLFAASKFVLVGDPEQLPPVVRSRAARRLGMEESLFHRLMRDDVTSTLQLQYRMNQPLADIANEVAYSGLLKCASKSVAQAQVNINFQKLSHFAKSPKTEWLSKACSPEPEYAAMFLDMKSIVVTDKNKSCTNVDEACLVMAIVDILIQGSVNPSEIGIISPYRDQVSLLRRSASRRSVECSTVDQFQGRDKSVILYSCTKRKEQEDRKLKEGEILNDQRRLAVSVTRAKHKFLMVGNSKALHRYAPLQRLIESCTTLIIRQDAMDDVLVKYSNEFY